MSKLGTVKFSGKSGTRYAFNAYPLETVFPRGFAGVYVVTRRREGKAKDSDHGGFVHRRLGTGQSDDLQQPLACDDQSFSSRGANCICVHAEKDHGARQRIEQDLALKPPVVWPDRRGLGLQELVHNGRNL